jgi:hypothetical protein
MYWGGHSKLSVECTDLKSGLDYVANDGHIAIDIEWALQGNERAD